MTLVSECLVGKWERSICKLDAATWDNRNVFSTPLLGGNDYSKLGDRMGHRAVGVGEKPYFV